MRSRSSGHATAASAIMIAVAAGLAACTDPFAGAAAVPAESLPWRALRLEGRPIEGVSGPAALLYVQPSCGHCDSAVVTFARETERAGVRALIVAAASRDEADTYSARFHLPPIATDSARDFARAAGIRLVPALVRVKDGSAATLPAPQPALLKRYIRSAR